jgi:LacI family transcriptional regulator
LGLLEICHTTSAKIPRRKVKFGFDNGVKLQSRGHRIKETFSEPVQYFCGGVDNAVDCPEYFDALKAWFPHPSVMDQPSPSSDTPSSPEGKPRLTLARLADHLGLAKSTVSMALSGRSGVSEKTRERVRQAAEDLGYRPDPIMSAFSRHRRGHEHPVAVMALVRNHPKPTETVDMLQEVARELGYLLDVFLLQDYPSQKALVHVLEARGVVGALIFEEAQPIALEPQTWSGMRCVYCGPYPGGGDEGCPFDVVRHNPFDALSLAWRKAREAGYRRIGLLFPTQNPTMSTLEEKSLAAYRFRRQQEADLPALEPYCRTFADFQSDLSEINRWITEQKPDVVLGGFQAIYGLLHQAGHRMPEDFGFIGLRIRSRTDEVSGCLIEKKIITQVALKHLHSLVQEEKNAISQQSTTLVVNPVWKAGRTFLPKSSSHANLG